MSVQLIKNILSEELFGSRICESLEQTMLLEYVYSNITFPEFIFEKLLIGEPITVPELRDLLRKNIVNFEFIKLDGDIRSAKGTTMMSHIPKANHPTGMHPSSEKVAAFWDLEKGAWRSVSNKSKEIIIRKDKETGKPKIVVSDKKPAEEPIEKEPEFKIGKSYNYTTNRGITTDVKIIDKIDQDTYQVYSPEFKTRFAISAKRIGSEIGSKPEPRPIPATPKPIVKPSIKPRAPQPIPFKPVEMPKPPVKSVPLNIGDATKIADEIQDKEIIAPGVERPAYKNEPLGIEPKRPQPEVDPLPPREEITFQDEKPEELEKPEEFEDGQNPSFES
jgi:hypothetical protein